MNKIFLIIQREYLSRVKKKSFIIMTIVSPILMASLFIGTFWLTAHSNEEEKTIGVIDETGFLYESLENNDSYKFDYLAYTPFDSAQSIYRKTKKYDAILYIPELIISYEASAMMFSEKQQGKSISLYIEKALEKKIRLTKAKVEGLSEDQLIKINGEVKVLMNTWDEEGKQVNSFTEVRTIIGLITAFMIYMFIFMYGTQVMKGVIEEKSNRIVEILMSSVKPFELMMGKVIGIAMVGLTQFLIWVVFTLILIVSAQFIAPDLFLTPAEQLAANSSSIVDQMGGVDNSQIQNMNFSNANPILRDILYIPFGMIVFSFIFYFIGGYLLFGALFAAIGAAVDNEADTQQFILPVTIPMVLSIMMFTPILENPYGVLAKFLSIFPFTSPIAMQYRIPFEAAEPWELILSMFLLIITFIGAIWVASKIYRTGILMYGKKVNYKELWKWLRY